MVISSIELIEHSALVMRIIPINLLETCVGLKMYSGIVELLGPEVGCVLIPRSDDY